MLRTPGICRRADSAGKSCRVSKILAENSSLLYQIPLPLDLTSLRPPPMATRVHNTLASMPLQRSPSSSSKASTSSDPEKQGHSPQSTIVNPEEQLGGVSKIEALCKSSWIRSLQIVSHVGFAIRSRLRSRSQAVVTLRITRRLCLVSAVLDQEIGWLTVFFPARSRWRPTRHTWVLVFSAVPRCTDTRQQVYDPFSTAAYGKHSLLGAIQVAATIIYAVGQPFAARFADITSRAWAYTFGVVFYSVGCEDATRRLRTWAD